MPRCKDTGRGSPREQCLFVQGISPKHKAFMRKWCKSGYKLDGVKIKSMSAFVRAIARSLKRTGGFPLIVR